MNVAEFGIFKDFDHIRNTSSTNKLKRTKATRMSTSYSPIDLRDEHDFSSHRSTVSSTSSRFKKPPGVAGSIDSEDIAIESHVSPFSPQTLVNDRWHGELSSADKHPEKAVEYETQHDEVGSTSATSLDNLGTGSWLLEIISLLASVSSIAAIIGVLAHFNGQSLPHWPEQITLNTLVALLSALATASIAAPLSSGLSQLKWIHFKGAHRPLTDMGLFDDASRGVYGAIKLLIFGRGGYVLSSDWMLTLSYSINSVLGSFGATITIVALAMGPFAQQIVAYRTRMVESHAAASVNSASNYTGFLPGDSSQSSMTSSLILYTDLPLLTLSKIASCRYFR